eukprot:COSAG03_NODE_1098_length_4823_cov_2.610711_4_plen_88_part_00
MHLIGAFAANTLTQRAEDAAVQSAVVLESVLKGYGLMSVNAKITMLSHNVSKYEQAACSTGATQDTPSSIHFSFFRAEKCVSLLLVF